ncbi:MAG: peptidase S8/S53 domain-containing protein [Linnemannia gamsii]|nr:MAG: peptidase S8/S53 domain-containing protein [Linnemannia gamsii]
MRYRPSRRQVDSHKHERAASRFLNFLLYAESIPHVLVVGYSSSEQTVPEDYAIRVCNLFAQLGAKGTTVVVSFGDSGVGGEDSGVGGENTCVANDGSGKPRFLPSFPANNVFRSFNTPGRANPDVAAQSENLQVVVAGRTVNLGGTGLSASIFGATVSLLNDDRLSQGRPTLEFTHVNSLIYSTAATGFNDVTSGSNPGCGTGSFPAGEGWDPVTGLGTPDFSKLRALL